MIKVRCPICSKRLEIQALADLPSFPFCTERCKLIDLGRWIDGTYIEAVIKSSEDKEGDSEGAVPLPEEDDGDS
jgi:uncharacterized protein